MKHLILILTFLSQTLFLSQNLKFEPWNDLLKNYVNTKGEVNYSKLKKNTELIKKCEVYFNKNQISNSWNLKQKQSYWINLYNFYTIKLVTENYPIKSIKDIYVNSKNAWEIPFVLYDNRTLTLNELENNIIRKESKDPRVHFLLNCASFSCPILTNYAIIAESIENELEKATIRFINDINRNNISVESFRLSEIFSWYKDDFNDIYEFIQKYSNIKINKATKITYLKYDWRLNE